MRGWLHPCTSLEREDRREGLAETGEPDYVARALR